MSREAYNCHDLFREAPSPLVIYNMQLTALWNLAIPILVMWLAASKYNCMPAHDYILTKSSALSQRIGTKLSANSHHEVQTDHHRMKCDYAME
jgi:hypothetical protein